MKRFLQSYGIILILSIEYAGMWAENIFILRTLLIAVYSLVALVTWESVPVFKKYTVYVMTLVLIMLAPYAYSCLISIVFYIIISVYYSPDFRKTFNYMVSFIITYISLSFLWHSSFLAANLLRNISYAITKALCLGVNSGTEFGPSLSLIVIFLSSVVHIAIRFLQSKCLYRLLHLVLLLVGYTCYINLLAIALSIIPKIACNFLPYVGVWLLSVKQLHRDVDKKELADTEELIVCCCCNKKTAVVIFAASYIAILLLFPQINFNSKAVSNTQDTKSKVAIVNSNPEVADFTISPTHKEKNIGFGNCTFLYGVFPMYLRQFGYNVEIYNSIEEALYDSDTIILAHYDGSSSPQLKNDIENYVLQGGVVVAFVDHTNIFNSAIATNELLSFSAVYAADDTCDSLLHYDGKVWENALDVCAQYSKIYNHIDINMGVWGGASIRSDSLLAESLITAKYGISDPADPSTGIEGGYMGNRKFDLGERAGDIPLAYRIGLGKGAVIFLGDTSYIQAPIPMYNWKFLHCLISNTNSQLFQHTLVNIIGIIAFAFIAMFSIGVFIKKRNAILLTTLLISITLSVFTLSVLQNIVNLGEPELDYDNNQYVYIDNNHKNSFSLSLSSQTQITGMGYSFMKNNLPVFVGNSNESLCAANIGIIVNPESKISESESEMILKSIYGGNNIILISGFQQWPNVQNILESFDVNISSFLGPIPWKHYGIPSTNNDNSPQFKTAWNVEYPISSPNISPLFEIDGYCCAIRIEYGAGNLFYIADDSFFVSSNLESEMDGNVANIAFVQSIIDTCCKLNTNSDE